MLTKCIKQLLLGGFHFYDDLDYFKGVDFLDLHPDWIIFIPRDYNFWGPDWMFGWLGHQDVTILRDVKIELVTSKKWIRLFTVAYPPGHPPKQPLPPFD